MFKKLIIILLLLILCQPVYAQEADDQTSDLLTQKEIVNLEAEIDAVEYVGVNKKIIFDASKSTVSSSLKQVYSWDFGDGNKAGGSEVVHQYTKTGKYTVSLTIKQGEDESKAQSQVFVYDKKALLITDEAKETEISQIKLQAAENGVALNIISTANKNGGFVTEEELIKEISQNSEYIKDSDLLIFYTRSSIGLQSFTNYWQNLSSENKSLVSKKMFAHISDSSLDVVSNFSYQSFNIIKPSFILLTRKESLGPLFTTKDYQTITNLLKSRGIEYKIINEKEKKSPVFFLSNLITSFISKGVSSNTIYLILIIPLAACVVIFFRQVIGLSTFGIYTPVITATSFYILGIGYGIVTFLFAVIIGYILKYILNKFELLYLSKVALNLAVISLSFLFIIWLFLFLDAPVSLSVAIFPILVMSSVVEKFMAAQSEEGFKGALFGTTETILVVVAAYYLISYNKINELIMSWPELVLIALIIILIIGKFSGLRLSEYIRFRSLFSEHTEE